MVEAMIRRGEKVRVWNRTASRTQPLARMGAEVARHPASAVSGASRVHLCLADDDAVDSVLAQAGEALRGTPTIDHSTVLGSGVVARAARLEAAEVPFLPAPVFMGPQNARDCKGIMLASGPEERYRAFLPWLQPMTTRVWYLGERIDLAAGYKLLGNGLLLSMLGVLGDFFQLARASGISEESAIELLEAMNPGASIAARGKKVLKGGFEKASFELAMARKDVRLMLETTGGRPMMVLPGVAAAMDRHLTNGGSALDFSIIARGD
jgi:3-hydroxyisobutyrate dehydrogenase-like beta-hydroxyacid dehydrogenase